MPGRRSLCLCLGGSPPEITYTRDHSDGIALKPFQPVDIPPMPDEDDLNVMFADLVDELGLDIAHKEAMFSLSADKKWQIYCSKKQEKDSGAIAWPDYYIDRLRSMSHFSFDQDSQTAQNLQLMDSLRTALRTQQMSFVLRFIDQSGLDQLLDFLKKMDYSSAHNAIHTSAIGCIKALMNSAEGRSHVLSHPECINIIAQSLIADNIRAKVAALEILGALCLVPGGHKKVLAAMLHFQKFACERTRFQTLINDLDRSTGEYRDDFVFKTAVMSFINAVLNYGAGQKHVEFRLHLRYEFLMLGIQPVLDKLRAQDNATLNRHIEFFDMVRMEDEKALAKKFETDHVDTKSASSMFELLRKKLSLSPAYSSFQSILMHLLQLPATNNACNQWQLLDKIVQQIVLQTKDGDPDVAPLELDVKKVARQLANENQLKETQQKIFEIQRENDEIMSKLTKKDRECEAKTIERDELQETLNKMRNKMERDAATLLESKAQLADLQATITDLAQLVELERLERLKLENAVKTGSLPDDDKVDLTCKSPAQLVASNALAKLASHSLSGPAPPPPPPPPGVGAPPPPPPPMAGPANGPSAFAAKKKDIPESKQPLKCFNWTKLPDSKVQGTIWQDLDDTKLYKSLDLDELELHFSAYQRQDGVDGDAVSRSSTVKAKELSVIDGRRAQNCTILLSKLKMTNAELTTAILNVDAQEELPKDMCEQLLKFVPTIEETQMLSEHDRETEQMARADRFLFEMSRVDHYEQRLKALYYKKKFSERMADLKPKVEGWSVSTFSSPAVLKSSEDLLKSKKLRKMFELVLAFGNYMNRGQRGNASGFKISSLSKIADTKSSVEKRTTLLHYLADIVERRFPDLVQLEKEMTSVRTAARVNLTELDAELNSLRSGLAEIKKELEYQQARGPSCASDKFGSIMANFVSIAMYNFSELEEQHAEMKEKFQKVVAAFCEDVKATQAEEFFGTFEQFLVAFEDARLENERFRKLREVEEKRALQEKQTKEKDKSKSKTNGKGAEDKGEFDDLISALRTGDVFGDDMAKMKRNRTPTATGPTANKRRTSATTTVIAASRDRIGQQASQA